MKRRFGVKDVLVTRKNDVYLHRCRLDPTGWRCGCCLRGLVEPWEGKRCKVCRAKVVSVRTWMAVMNALGSAAGNGGDQ